MADLPGAVAAARTRFVDRWKTGDDPRTVIAFQNEPPVDADGAALQLPPTKEVAGKLVVEAWVYFEVIFTKSEIRGAGLPGNQTWLYWGHIYIHVFVPEGYGIEDAHRLAFDAGEIFRAATFYNDEPGVKLICMAPWTDGGETDADNGNSFRVTCTVPFEFYYLG